MTHTPILSEREEYYLSYGLDRDPFPEGGIDNIFYITPELNQRIELIKHLLDNSRQVLIITGPGESGKSTLAKYLLSVFDDGRPVSRVWATKDMDREILAGMILEDTQHLGESSTVSSVSRLHQYLEFCDMEQRQPLIIIDDGHWLSIDTLNFILQMNALDHNNTRFRFVIFAGEEINRTLESPGIKMSDTGIVHSISLPLIAPDQVPDYLQHRLDSSGNVNRYPFSDRDADYMYRVSGGAPGRINRLARQAMQDPADYGQTKESPYDVLKTTVLRGIRNPVVIGTIISLGIVLYYVTVGGPGEQPRAPAATRGTITREAEEVAEPPRAVSPPVETVTTPEPDVEPEQDRPLSAMLAGIRGNDWIRAQAPDSYALQMIGARDIRTLEKFLATVPEMRDRLAILTTSNAGRPWYVFLYGLYPDRAAAVADLAGLPPEARVNQPWARAFSSIHQDLDKSPGKP